jgi:hypothetical protein
MMQQLNQKDWDMIRQQVAFKEYLEKMDKKLFIAQGGVNTFTRRMV